MIPRTAVLNVRSGLRFDIWLVYETNERSGMVAVIGFRIPKTRSHIGNVMMSVAAGVAASCSDPRVADHAVSGGEIRILGWARLGVGLLREPPPAANGVIC